MSNNVVSEGNLLSMSVIMKMCSTFCYNEKVHLRRPHLSSHQLAFSRFVPQLLWPGQDQSGLFLIFCSIIFFYYLADGIVSYINPVYMEGHLPSPAVMGTVMSFSSLVGFVCDLIFPKLFRHQNFWFFLRSLLMVAVSLPLIMIWFPASIGTFLLAMTVWGIYYELGVFTNFNFVHGFTKVGQHAEAWGLLYVFKALAYTLGPLLAIWLIDQGEVVPYWGGIISLLMAGVAVAVLKSKYARQLKNHGTLSRDSAISVKVETKVWWLLIKKVWPLYWFLLSLFLLDSSFWTIGTLFSEQLRTQSWVGGLLLSAYELPSLFFGFLAGNFARRWGKKRSAFGTSIMAGLLLAATGMVNRVEMLVGLVFLASTSLAIAWPEIYGTFEDYVSRLGVLKSDMIGLQASAGSLAYIGGPMIAGWLASGLGEQMSLAGLGWYLAGVSLVLLVIMPRKIRLPQGQLQQVLTKS